MSKSSAESRSPEPDPRHESIETLTGAIPTVSSAGGGDTSESGTSQSTGRYGAKGTPPPQGDKGTG